MAGEKWTTVTRPILSRALSFLLGLVNSLGLLGLLGLLGSLGLLGLLGLLVSMAELEHDWSLLDALAPELLDLCLSFVSGCDIAALGCTSTLWRCRAFEQRWDWWHGACCREFVPVLVLGSREPVAYLGDLAWWKAEYARRYLYTLARCCMCFAASARPFAVWQLGRYRLCARCCSTEEQLLTADKCRAKVRSSRRKALVDTIGSLPRRIAS